MFKCQIKFSCTNSYNICNDSVDSSETQPVLSVDSLGHVLHAFVNGAPAGKSHHLYIIYIKFSLLIPDQAKITDSSKRLFPYAILNQKEPSKGKKLASKQLVRVCKAHSQ